MLELSAPAGAVTSEAICPACGYRCATRRGDLYVLGRHRLLCGDSSSASDVEAVTAGRPGDLLICDPPYGMRLDTSYSSMRQYGWMANGRTDVKQGNDYDAVAGDDRDFDARPTLALWGEAAEQFWFGADYYAASLPDAEHSGSWLVWDKRVDENLDRMFGSAFELIWSRRRRRREILRVLWAGLFGSQYEPEQRRFHPNQKPIALLAELFARAGTARTVDDPFAGSGSTVIAAERADLICRAIELDPHNCDVIVGRWERLTGQKARRIEAAVAA